MVDTVDLKPFSLAADADVMLAISGQHIKAAIMKVKM
jgi:hypothetical protein